MLALPHPTPMNASTPPAVSDILDRIDALGDDERDLLDLHLLRLREAEKERAREHLNALLREGLGSGTIVPGPDYFEKKKRELLERHARQQQ